MDPPVSPDWSAVADEVLCPLCRYNLRGLAEPRCPECGYAFEWSEILDPTRRLHPYLFEHHPERNLWSFLRTLIGGLRPWRFWSTLHPVQPANAGRLTIYHLLICALALLPAVARVAAIGMFSDPSKTRWDDGRLYQTELDELPFAEFLLAPVEDTRSGNALWLLPATALLLPYSLLLPLGIFQWSMHKAQVGWEHVRRCVIYSSDAIVWVALALTLMVAYAQYEDYHDGVFFMIADTRHIFAVAAFVAIPAGWMFMTWRLAHAYKRYLRFDHAWAVVLSAQLILLLALAVLSLGISALLPVR